MSKNKKRPPARDPEDLLNLLVCGNSGSGKTTTLAHFAKLGKVIHCDAESGLRKRPLRQLGVPVDNIDKRRITKFGDLEAVYREAFELLAEDPFAIFAINIDTTTEMYQVFMEEVLRDKRKRFNKSGMEWDDEAGRDEHRIVTQRFRRIARRFRDLPCHVGWTAHLNRDVDDDGAVAYRAALTPAFGKTLEGYLDVITTQLEYKGGIVAVCRQIGKYKAAKDRIGFLPRVLANPTADRMVNLLDGKLDLDIDPAQRAYRKSVRKG